MSGEKKITLNYVDKSSGIEQILHGYYKINFSKRPISLSINQIQEIDFSLHTIISIKEDKILMAKFSPKWRLRPLAFDNKSILLKKLLKIQKL